MKINPLTAIDFYKADHKSQYPEGTTLVYSNFTPRNNNYAMKTSVPELQEINDRVVVFGLQMFIKDYLIDLWNTEFFNKPKEEVLRKYKRRMDTSLGPDSIDVSHIEALHDLGYLPLLIKAVPEGTLLPAKVPMLTIVNTEPGFFWLTNYLESVMSAELWKPATAATIAYKYRKVMDHFARKTGAFEPFVAIQGHDFSFRGMSGMVDAARTGVGHLTSFVGTDTVLAIDAAEDYYFAFAEQEVIGISVPATEHSVMCMGGEGEGEFKTFKRLITDVYPTGVVSIVSDTWDFWKVLTEYLPALRHDILGRQGKVVIRPDSGDPVKIICGDPDAQVGSPEFKGAIELLWEVFGGTINSKGYKELAPEIGLIYGDSITLERCETILSRLALKKFASSNVVMGIGSYTYNYNTRDSHGFAMKATYGEVNGVGREIFKDPKTDSGVKKSARGLLCVTEDFQGTKVLKDQVSWEDEGTGDLVTVFSNGQPGHRQSLAQIRERLHGDKMDCSYKAFDWLFGG